MNFKFWKRRAEQPEPAGPSNPVITLGVTPDGKLDKYAFFPEYPPEVAEGAAKNFATLLFLLNDGKLLSTLQEAVVLAALDGPGAEFFSNIVMRNLNAMNEEAAKMRGEEGGGKRLLVSARETFGYNAKESRDR